MNQDESGPWYTDEDDDDESFVRRYKQSIYKVVDAWVQKHSRAVQVDPKLTLG